MRSTAVFSFFSFATIALASPTSLATKRQSLSFKQVNDLVDIWHRDLEGINILIDHADSGNFDDRIFRESVGGMAATAEMRNALKEEFNTFSELLPVLGLDQSTLGLMEDISAGQSQIILQEVAMESPKFPPETQIVAKYQEFRKLRCDVLKQVEAYWDAVLEKTKDVEGDLSRTEAPMPEKGCDA